MSIRSLPFIALLACSWVRAAYGADTYFAHPIRQDRHGVIAPWYTGLNGQCDLRVRVAAETLKRYPWTEGKDGRQLPDYIYNGRWSIAEDGTITPGRLEAWGNGDLVQRGTYAIFGLVQYYRYAGDPAAVAHISLIADAMLDRCRTGPNHPWPDFIISVPNSGEPYGRCNEHGMIQLDLAAMAGIGLIQAHQVTGEARYLQAARHWADLLAAKRDRTPGEPPWNRYANPQDVFWNDRQTGGVVLVVRLFDELIRLGYTGDHEALIEARDAGRAYLDELLSDWLVHDTWARDYWDWEHTVQSEDFSEMVPRYFMRQPDAFPNWAIDARNIMSLFLTRACATAESRSGVYHGAWAYPEGSQCCGVSLNYAPMQVGAAFAEYGVTADSSWARELARRQFILATYDAEPNGVVRDGIDGSNVVAGGWFQISHPLPLDYVLDGMGWLPQWLGANRENHIMRSSSTVSRVEYAPGRIQYQTSEAPPDSVDVLRLAFAPTRITADGQDLPRLEPGGGSGYQVVPLSNGDCLVTIRHDNARTVVVQGDRDPQRRVEGDGLALRGTWRQMQSKAYSGGLADFTDEKGATLSFAFEGNQVRVIGSAWPAGGKADVSIDGVRQLCGIDEWCPVECNRQVVYYRNGLPDGRHTLQVTALGDRNPVSKGTMVNVDAIDCSAATGDAGFGEGGGPADAQRWIFGYPLRQDYLDSQGNSWRPATEVVIRVGDSTDATTAWYTSPRRLSIEGTQDPVLYRYGMHGHDFTAYATVAPGAYHVRLKFMETRHSVSPEKRAMDLWINGRQVAGRFDVAATAAGVPSSVIFVSPNGKRVHAGLNKAVDLVFNEIRPEHGVIAVRFVGSEGGEAIVSAMEVGPGPGGFGATPVPLPASQPAK
jgi:hypothetical protein